MVPLPHSRVAVRTTTNHKVQEIILLGTGTSTCTPNLSCIASSAPSCRVCLDALRPDSPNRRLNTSSLIRYRDSSGTLRNIMIDCGKSFYMGAAQWLFQHKISTDQLDGVILTHGHADAMMGLDDLRGWANADENGQQKSIKIYLNRSTLQVVEQVFPYLVDTRMATGGGYVTALDFHLIDDDKTFTVGELELQPLLVEHGLAGGRPFYCLAFWFDGIVYMSDVSRVPEAVVHRIMHADLLVLDCLRETPPYRAHFVLRDCIEIIERVSPGMTVLVGLSHTVEHAEFEKKLPERVIPGRDGMRLELKAEP